MTNIPAFGTLIINWYHQNKRNLPWRNTSDPYKIWISEIILQQTRVNQGLDYYNRFVVQFPSIESLANAPEFDVLKLWQGLGYYSRARNLHAASKQIVNDYNGIFPTSFVALKNLKGVGDYTAAAIASIAYNEAVPVVDGNVYRVLSRVFGIETPIDSSKAKFEFFNMAQQQLMKHKPSDFNQAIMEFGALQCVPQNPNCEDCIFKQSCVAFNSNLVNVLPIKLKATKVSNRYLYYIVLLCNNKVYMKQRLQSDIWQGLYDFPAIESTSSVEIEQLIKSEAFFEIVQQYEFEIGTITKSKLHKLSHLNIHATFIQVKLNEPLPQLLNYIYVSELDVAKLPISKLVDRYLYKR